MIKRLLLGSALLLTAINTMAQRNSASPYSFFGIGENFEAITVEQASMGGIGVALQDVNHLNFTNPAAMANIRYATYTLGGSLSLLTLDNGVTKQHANSTNLRYIALGFPIGNKAGFSVGLQPFSSVGYSLQNTINAETSILRGAGGTNKLYANFGMYAYKGLALGIEAGFIFGNIENSVISQVEDVVRATKNNQDITVRGTEFKLGAQYQTKIKNNLTLSLGTKVGLATNLNTSTTNTLYSLTFGGSGQEIPRDTLTNATTKGAINLPFKTVVGAGIGKANKWYVGVNQEFQEALTASQDIGINTTNYRYTEVSKFSLGGYYIPKFNSISSYWHRVTYRAGVRFQNTGLEIANTSNNFTSVKDFGINVGLGLPMPRQLSNINLGFEYGQRGSIANNLIKESYYNIRLSLSLNSANWFQKRRID